MKTITLVLWSFTALLLGSCGNSKEIDDKKNETVPKEVTHQDISGVDFYANAEDESWKLSITFDEEIVFTDTKNNIQFSSKNIDKQVAQGADVVNISAKSKTHVFRINIDIAECKHDGKQVNIMVRKISEKNGLDYNGCGYYRGSPQLHNIWALHQINGKEITADQFPNELPHFEFNLETKQISGFAGCNQVNGKIKFEYSKVIIEPLSSTKMYCGETSTVEEDILNILRSGPIYSINNLQLTLESVEGSIILKKVD
jgi:heat shock protein HslJ